MPIQNITGLPNGIGLIPQIAFQAGFVKQLSQDLRDFQLAGLFRRGKPQGRELRFLMQMSGGPAAIQSSSISNMLGNFPVAQDNRYEEKVSIFKQLDATIRISDSLARRLSMSGAIKYGEQLGAELDSKINLSKRRVGADFHLDGTGVMSTVASVVDTTGAAGVAKVTVTVDQAVAARGHVNACEFEDLYKSAQQNGTAVTPTVTGTFAAWKIADVRREANQLVLQPVDASGNALAMSASNLAATHVFYRYGQLTIPDLTAAIGDYVSATEVMVGLPSLIADDGRVVAGVVMDGISRSLVRNKTGETADIRHLTELMTALKNRNGQSSNYKYSKVLCSGEYVDALGESQRQDLRFKVGEGTLGAPDLHYQHGQTKLELYSTEFCRKDVQYVIPSGSGEQPSPIQVHFSDFEAVAGPDGGNKWHLARDTDGRAVKAWEQYMSAFIGSFNCAPSSCGKIVGATVGV